MRLNEKQKVLATAGVFVVLAAGMGGLNYLKLRDRGALLSKIDTYLEEEKKATEKMSRIPELREQRSKLINIIDQYAEILPKEEHVQLETFAEIIDGYRKDTKIVIQKAEYIRPKSVNETAKKKDKVVVRENFLRHRYKFKLLGTVPDLIEFVNKIENHTRFLKVDAINIRPVGSQADESDDMSDKGDDEELARASEPVKEIELTVSTYTYSKGQDKKG